MPQVINKYQRLKLYSINIVFLLIISGLVFSNFSSSKGIVILNDEFGYWANAATLAGYDWKPLIEHTPYYSLGYSLILVPIMKYLPTPELWYKGAIVLNVVLLWGSYGLCVLLGRKLFPKYNVLLICLMSFVVIIYPANIIYAQVAWSETLLTFLIWLSVVFLMFLEERFSLLKLFFFLLSITYIYLVHPRGVPIVVFGFVISLLEIWKNTNELKKKILYLVSFVLLFTILYFSITYIKGWQVNTIWNNSDFSNINNVNLNSSFLIGVTTQLSENLCSFLLSLLGKIEIGLVSTAFTLFIPLSWFITKLVNYFRDSKKFKSWIFWLWVVMLPIGMLILTSYQMLDWQSRKDMLVYSRYFDFSVGPSFMLGLGLIMKKSKLNWNIQLLSGAVFLLLLWPTYYLINNSQSFFNSVCAPYFGAYLDNVSGLKQPWLVIGLLGVLVWSVQFTIQFYGSSSTRRTALFNSCLQIALVFMMTAYLGETFVLDVRKTRNELNESFNVLTDNKKLVYIRNESIDSYCTEPKYLQFTIPDKTIEVLTIEELHDLEIKDYRDVNFAIAKEDTEAQKIMESEKYKPIDNEFDSNLIFYQYEPSK